MHELPSIDSRLATYMICDYTMHVSVLVHVELYILHVQVVWLSKCAAI